MVKFSISHLIFIKKYDIILKKGSRSVPYAHFSGESASFLLFHCYQRANNAKRTVFLVKTSSYLAREARI